MTIDQSADVAGKEAKSPRKRAHGIDRMLEILDTLCAEERELTSYEIAKLVGAPISTIYTLVAEMVERGLLSRRVGNTVWLGPRTLRYGIAFEKGTNLLALARQEMHELARRLGETVQVCVRDEDMMVVAAMADGIGHFRVTSDVGTRVPLNWTASGRLLVGHLPSEERLAVFLACSQPSPTERAETDPRRLTTQAEEDFTNRLSIQIGQSDYAVACIASPIRDATGACVATISVVLPEQRATERRDEICDAVRDAAALIEAQAGVEHGGRRMGHSG